MLLSITIDGEKPFTVSIDQEICTLGRSQKASVQIENECVSRLHLQIRKTENGSLFIKDLGSSNGTFLNNERILSNEEVQWHTFFPLNLSHKIFISVVNEVVAPAVTSNHTTEPQTVNTTPQRELKKKNPISEDLTRVRKAPIPPRATKKDDKNSLMMSLVGILALGIAVFYYQNKNQSQEESIAREQNLKVNQVSEISQKTLSLVSQKKCLSGNEIKFCEGIKTSSEKFEGTVISENQLYLFINFGDRLKEATFDPSFSFADKKEQITYLMVFMIFSESTRSFAQPLNIKNLIIADSSYAPTKINQVLKIARDDLFKLSTTDLETIKSLVIKKDTKLFEAVIVPLIKVESFY